MSRYVISQYASKAIEDIYVYTANNFGEKQADAYHDGLHEVFELLAEFPEMGMAADEIMKGLRKFYYKYHVIYYRRKSDVEIYIQHVLHVKQDIRSLR